MKRTWTEEMNNYVRENYGKIPAKEIAKQLNKTSGAIVSRAKYLGLRYESDYSEQEKEMFKRERHLCWKCKHAVNKPVVVQIVKGKPKMVGKCPWADRLEPVKGWETITVGYRGGIKNDDNCDKTERFAVIKCPLYEVG